METLFLYLIKSSGLLAAFFLGYHLLLRKETFFTSNRWFLLLGLLTAAILPLITFTKVVWIDPIPSAEWTEIPLNQSHAVESFTINWYWVAACIYGAGFIMLLLRLFFDYRQLTSLLKGKTIEKQANFKYVNLSESIPPFSYFNYIVYNANLYTETELQHILAHEKVHCIQKHSIDVLLMRVFCILFWYNPFVWLYKKAVLQNLEFIADSEVLKNSIDKKNYQITLLKVTTQTQCVAITNPFYQSLIKKRIVMLNTNQSKQRNVWKYAFMIPVVIAFLLYFQVKVIAQEKPTVATTTTVSNPEEVAVVIDKNTTDEQLKAEAERVQNSFGITLKFTKIKRNAAGEITAIKATYKDKDGKKGTYLLSGDEPIAPVRFFKNDNGAIGFGSPKTKIITLKKEGEVATTDNETTEEIIINDDQVEAPEPPETPEAPEAPEAPESPKAPHLKTEKRIVLRTKNDGNGKISISVNGETIDIDTDKILADLEPIINQSIEMEGLSKADMANLKRELKKIGPAVRKATKEVMRVKMDPERMKKEMAESDADIQQSKRDIEESKRDIEQAKRDLEEAKKDLEQSKKDLEQARKELLKKNK